MDDGFDYDKAEADLYDSDCSYADEIYSYKSERGRDEFMREHGLNPDNYKNGGNHDSSSYNSDPCYLTSACVIAKGLSDNCEELTVLRAFRDGYLTNRPDGMIDIHHYYKVAPHIVDAINSKIESCLIWQELYEELIRPCVDMIKSGSYEKAYLLYKTTTEGLEKKFHIE